MRTRCPSCGHSYTTDRGVLNHAYSDTTPEQARLARETLAAVEYEVPLPLAMEGDDLPVWASEQGVQDGLPGVIVELSNIMGTI